MKHYKLAAEKAGLKVKFINISIDDEFKYKLTHALLEGIYQTKAKYIHDQNHSKLSNFNFVLNKIDTNI